jgi:hypothetical protein
MGVHVVCICVLVGVGRTYTCAYWAFPRLSCTWLHAHGVLTSVVLVWCAVQCMMHTLCTLSITCVVAGTNLLTTVGSQSAGL